MININILSNMFKVKYDNLETKLSVFKGRDTRFLLVINIGKILDTLYSIINRKQFIITKKDRVKILVGLLNIIAHYRHYYYSLRKANNFILLYCDNQKQYIEHEEILSELKSFLDFIPSTVLVPKISFPTEIDNKRINTTFYYTHTVAHIIDNTKRKCEALNKKLVVNVFGNDPLDFQFLPITESMYFINPFGNNQVNDFKDLWVELTAEDERFSNIIYELELKYLLLPYALFYNKMPVNFNKKYKMDTAKSITIKNRLNNVFMAIENSKGLSSFDMILNFTQLTYEGDDVNKYLDQMKRRQILFFYNTAKIIKPVINDLMKSWGKKIKDSGIHNLNEIIDSFTENNLNIGWLLEDKGDI